MPVAGALFGWEGGEATFSASPQIAIEKLAANTHAPARSPANRRRVGLGCGAVGFLIYGAAPTGPVFWLGIPVMALWGVAGAATQALTTQLVAPDQQGQLQGATSSVQSLSQLVGPFLFTLTFAYFIGAQAPLKLPGAPFLLASALLVLALVIAARTLAVAPAGRAP